MTRIKEPEVTDMGRIKTILIFLCFILIVFCRSETSDSEVDNPCRQEPCYEGPFDPPWVDGLTFIGPRGEQWTHDNRVLETDHFLVFSDSSSDEAKIRFGEACEASLVWIMEFWRINESSELGILGRDSKLNVYSTRSRGMRSEEAFENGFVMYGFDSGVYLNMSREQQENRHRVFTHECTHVTQFLLGGDYRWVHTWMTEGLAEYVSGGVFAPVDTVEALDSWLAEENHGNPVSIDRFEEIPLPYNQSWQYYPMFHLAFRYLLDPGGLNRTPQDIRYLFRLLQERESFPDAFEAAMGISLTWYEENFFTLIRDFLENNPPARSSRKLSNPPVTDFERTGRSGSVL